MIQLKQIYKRYQAGESEMTVLQDINFTVNQGEYVAIMGQSGSGKSTLMNILGCLDHPSEGSYWIDGVDVLSLDDPQTAQLRNRMIGFIFQQFQLLPRLTAKRNVELPLIYAGLPAKKREERAIESLRKVGLEDRMHHLPSALSGGQQQRVAIARAMVTEPTLLLADEPTGALDTQSGAVVLDLFDQLHQEGKTIVMITHDAEVATRAQRQIIIRDGEIIEEKRRPVEGEMP
ncbi:ABC transporter ATP-binding protein [Hazenella sp. IB182357]|uniref:ABC transporter ATP-binding protein n=1 Tax=Polycladospora coralii TaxID=2771432 RepID=A0A926N5S5_9BACL|nr:ABC transporter ATP-binding protein [Polycladospora coralii]MBD1372049.1 ABC transporter ATP-binding protein [Polycladospora coralii]MBS7530555.1 ABC transporter ATP-binding protein [Polycladospora coralii]